MTIHRFFAISVLFLLLLSGCRHHATQVAVVESEKIDSLIPEFSKTFRIEYYKGYKLIHVYGKEHQLLAQYILHKKDVTIQPDVLKGATEIISPVARIACMSTTHVGALSILNARSLIVATTNKDLIFDTIVRTLLESGAIKDIGKDYQPDYELVEHTKPDLLFSDGENSGSSQMLAKMRSLGVKVVSSRDYFEQDPLARAEWIKFFAAFIDKEKMADSIFSIVRNAYQSMASVQTKKATVFCNLPYSGVWYMPCGKNYNAKMISDAGGDFLWNNEEPINGLNLTLNFEQVYERASDADVWINTGVSNSLNQITAQDKKFKLFKAYKTGRVFNGTKRVSPGGGLDVWETGTYRPDIVKRDLTKIFQSSVVSDTDLYYYQQLK